MLHSLVSNTAKYLKGQDENVLIELRSLLNN
jgi:hypothetical protein